MGYPTRLNTKSDLLSGVIATSPLILLSKPASKIARWVGGRASTLLPNVAIPADTKPEVSCGHLAGLMPWHSPELLIVLNARPGRQRSVCERPSDQTDWVTSRGERHARWST